MDGREWLVEFSRDKKPASRGVVGGNPRDRRNCLKVIYLFFHLFYEYYILCVIIFISLLLFIILFLY